MIDVIWNVQRQTKFPIQKKISDVVARIAGHVVHYQGFCKGCKLARENGERSIEKARCKIKMCLFQGQKIRNLLLIGLILLPA